MKKEIIQNILEIRLLSERIEKHLTEEQIEKRTQELILEMAFYRDEFKNYLLNLTKTIISDFALIVYAHITQSHLEALSHWKGELKDRIIEFQEMETKPKKGNRKMVERVLKEAWLVKLELPSHPNIVLSRYETKFEEEGIITNPEQNDIIIRAFLNNIPLIINEMAYGTKETALQYVNSITIE